MGFSKYDRYKDSGVDWLGEIPKHWTISSIRAVTKLKSIKNKPELQILSVYREFGVVQKDSRDDNHNATSLDTSTYKVVEVNDLVVNKMKAWQGSMGVSKYSGLVSPAYITCQLKTEFIHPDFLHYLLRSKIYIATYASLSYGVRIGQWDMHYEDFKKIPIVYPSIAEQKRIAEFLDRKCSEIDEAIAKKQRLIELLDEQKTILINQAVTKGLDPDVPMKDSGIDWLGEIPKYWEVKKLKRLFKEVDKRSKDGREELLSLRMYEGLVFHNNVSDKRFKPSELIGYKCIEKGQIVMNRMRAAIGLFGLCEIPGLVSPDYATFDAKEDIKQEYYLHLFKTKALKDQFRLDSKGLGTGSSGFLRLYSDKFGMIKVPFPTKEEQSKIVEYLQKVSIRFSEAILKVREDLSKLEELKKVLIAEAVTGKIKI